MDGMSLATVHWDIPLDTKIYKKQTNLKKVFWKMIGDFYPKFEDDVKNPDRSFDTRKLGFTVNLMAKLIDKLSLRT